MLSMKAFRWFMLPSCDDSEQRRIPVRIRFSQLLSTVATSCGWSSAEFPGSLLVFMWHEPVTPPQVADEGQSS